MPSIKLQGQSVEYSVRKSKRAKRINIRIDPKKGLELVYPTGVKHPKPREILTDNQAWVLATLDKVQTRHANRFQRRYAQDEIFPYLGEDKSLNLIQESHGKRINVRIIDHCLTVSLPPEVDIKDTEAIRQAVESFYRREAQAYLPDRARELADRLGFDFNRVTIKNQKTRWGSCSTKNNLNFNLRLMMTPPDAINYIIIHELCHLEHMNHSKQFWRLVGKHCPEYNYWRTWFKQNSEVLIL